MPAVPLDYNAIVVFHITERAPLNSVSGENIINIPAEEGSK
jgi:hypothetical protein